MSVKVKAKYFLINFKFEQKESSGNIAWLDEAVLKFKRALGI
ncbi:hypothetical protein [Campylobacter showae]|nr:hypothetical protein [Campylobacter showae]